MSVINTASDSVVQKIHVASGPLGLVAGSHDARNWLYVVSVNDGGVITAIDTDTNLVEGEPSVIGGRRQHRLRRPAGQSAHV